ncbi:MAG: hypothetical protein ACE5KE_05895 [Methanosarcinales archaeon]
MDLELKVCLLLLLSSWFTPLFELNIGASYVLAVMFTTTLKTFYYYSSSEQPCLTKKTYILPLKKKRRKNIGSKGFSEAWFP